MNFKSSFNYIVRNLREKHRFSIRNQHTDKEVWYMYLSPMNLIAGFVALVLVLFIIITTTVAYTPILDMIPGYPGNKSRAILIQNIMRLDSLEQEIHNMQIYGENIALIMAGKNPVTRNNVGQTDSLSKERAIVASISADSVLRSEMESENGAYSLSDPSAARQNLRNALELCAPIKGVVTRRFSPIDNRYGTTLTAGLNQPVMAASDGMVISSSWLPDEGYALFVQHADNIVSVYRHIASVLKKTGERVTKGESIGYTSGQKMGATPQKNLFEFELWHNGTPIDPERYVVF